MKRRLAGPFIVCAAAIVATACDGRAANPAAPDATIVADSASAGAATGLVSGPLSQSRLDVCHRTAGSEDFILLSVAAAALDAHLKHGDGRVGFPVPAQPGMKFGPDCAVVAQGPVTIAFGGLLVNGAPFTSYTESGFTVVATAGAWEVRTDYGHPGPFIQFRAADGSSTMGQVTVTAGASTFRFLSVDLYSSVTTIPYVFTGSLGSTVQFSVGGTQPNTFGNFATIPNPESSDVIDTLTITLTNAPPPCVGCGSNPMGLDNIVLIQ